jgi:hypothetical protein
MSLEKFDERAPLNESATILLADGTNPKTIFTAGGSGVRVDDLIVTNSEGATKDLAIYLGIDASLLTLANWTIPATAGSGSVAPSQVPTAQWPANQTGWVMAPGNTLKCALAAAMTGSNELRILVLGGHL